MSKDTVSGGCQQRYKGIENFLRRVAFNLGNTPSETEVKIISCIPIDVTDLQQKIVDLEKQLEEATNKAHSTAERRGSPNKLAPKPSTHTKSPTKSPTRSPTKQNSVTANQVTCKNTSEDGKGIVCNHSTISVHFDYSPGTSKKSAISFLYPTTPVTNCNVAAKASRSSNKQEKCKDPKKSFFIKRRSHTTKKKDCKTELVYYAAANTKTPFNHFALADDVTSKNAYRERHDDRHDDCNDDDVYFSHIINKQYMPRTTYYLSNTSEFSSPVCRDNATRHITTSNPYESDVCSCCRGPFQNLDRHMTGPAHRFDLYPSFTDKENDNKYAYYDSSAYDVIPVREKNYKSADDYDVLNRRDFNRHIDIKCWPESVRPKKVQNTVPMFREGRRKQRVIANCHNTPSIRYNLKMKTNKRNYKKDHVLNKMAAKRPMMTHSLNLKKNSLDSKICEVDFGEIYAKHNRRQKLFPKPVIVHNASCSTTILNNSECQTGVETNERLVEDKTATTLKQIKEILQSVLTEVKTKDKLTSHPEPKKDAVVQNSFSQSNICGGSHLLNSFTYSHYNTNPYIASCSRQIPSNNYCPANTGQYNEAKCIQQYPLFVQPNRQLCTTCRKNNQVTKQSSAPAPVPATAPTAAAVTAATNTDQTRDRSKETQKLIKEIYNSIALNIEIPTKDTDLNQGDQNNNNSKTYLARMDTEKEINQREKLISEIFKNSNPVNTSVTEKMTPVSKLTSNDTTFRSGYINNHRTPLTNKHTTEDTTATGDTDPDRDEVYREGDSDDEEDQSDDTAVNDNESTESSTTDDETDKHVPFDDQQSSKKIERKSILSKMFNLFTPKSRRQPQKSVNDSESNSDDYQTVYSQKITARPKRDIRKLQEVRKVYRHLPTKMVHSQIMKQQSPERFKRTPYMEQEYRRYWDEKLLFQDRYAKQSTEASRVTTPQTMARPVYFQNYEAMSALVEPNRRLTTTTMQNINRNPARRSSYATNRTTGNRPRPRVATKGLAWLKKHKLGVQCGEQWKKLILEG